MQPDGPSNGPPRQALSGADIRTLGMLVGGLKQNRIIRLMGANKMKVALRFMDELDLDFIVIHQRFCPNNRLGKVICEKCMISCPTTAIEFDVENGFSIDQQKCLQCGICGPACPIGVFEPKRPSDTMLLTRIGSILEGSEDKVLSIRCDGMGGSHQMMDQPKGMDGSLVLPCLGRVSETMVLWTHLLGASSIIYSECDGSCPYISGYGVFERTRLCASHLVAAIGGGSYVGLDTSHFDLIDAEATDRGTPPTALDRRSFFGEIGRTVSRTLEKESQQSTEDVPIWIQRIPPNKRYIRYLAKRNGFNPHPIDGIDGLPFADIAIDKGACDFCGVCTVLCPTGALLSIEVDDIGGLCFSFWKCTGCGLCQVACQEDAISIGATADLGDLPRDGKVLVRFTKEECRSCGMSYVENREHSYCPQCDKRAAIEQGLVESVNDRG